MMAGPGFGIPPKEDTNPRSIARRAVFEEFQRQNSGIRVVNAGGLELTGDNADRGFLMSMAGDTAPDVFYVNFRQYYNFVDQGFCRPLNDLIDQDPESLKRINPTILEVIKSYDGKTIYAVPFFQVAQALYYRKDIFAEAGLNPDRPPRTWDEFYRYGQKIAESAPGRSGFGFSAGPGLKAYGWVNFLWQAGGDAVEPTGTGPWRSTIATKEGAVALDFYRRMMGGKWVGKGGKTFGPMAIASPTLMPDIQAGKIGMWFSYTNDVVMNMTDINPSVLGIAQMPAGPAGHANEINAGMWAINKQVTDPAKIDACWRFIKFFSGDEAARLNTERFVELGLGNLVNPTWLKKFGYDDILASVDPTYVKANEALFDTGHPEPYGRNMQQVYLVMDGALDRALLEPETPAMEILAATSKEMNQKLLGFTPPEILAKQRAWATGILVAIGVVVLVALVPVIGRIRRNGGQGIPERLPAGLDRSRVYRFVALCLIPAVATIGIWHYYPLLRGLVIAFQDYRILEGTRWAGLDNFIAVFTQPIFWIALRNSLLYVILSIAIGFLLPIGLALALNEIPRWKVLFRTLFYLPAMTSPILIALLWRQFYDKSETGLLNSLLLPIIEWANGWLKWAGIEQFERTHDWLGNPSLAMFAVVLPGIWAAAGPGSILYLAALKNIPEERYEAADLDGATWISKIRYITLPGLKPLILINLLGVFIAGFKAMENIFVLTGGGPLYSTHTLGLEVWTNAFMFLKFGYATAAAWVMGAILIGFTLVQIKNLTRMRFSTARF